MPLIGVFDQSVIAVEPSFIEDFLFTYRTFLTPHALLLLLILRYWVPLDEKWSKEPKKERVPIQMKFATFLPEGVLDSLRLTLIRPD